MNKKSQFFHFILKNADYSFTLNYLERKTKLSSDEIIDLIESHRSMFNSWTITSKDKQPKVLFSLKNHETISTAYQLWSFLTDQTKVEFDLPQEDMKMFMILVDPCYSGRSIRAIASLMKKFQTDITNKLDPYIKKGILAIRDSIVGFTPKGQGLYYLLLFNSLFYDDCIIPQEEEEDLIPKLWEGNQNVSMHDD